MKLIQGCTYKVPGCSLHIYVRKIRHTNIFYSMCIVEFVKKGKKWVVFQTIKNCKLYHDQISHWERVKESE